MRSKVLRWCATLVAFLSLLWGSLMPGQAMAATDARHSVVVIEAGLLLDGEWIGLPVRNDKGEVQYDDDGNVKTSFVQGTAFFVGKSGENPQYLLTNRHVISEYEYWGAGTRSTLTQENGSQIVYKSALRIYYDSMNYESAYYVDSDARKDLALLRLDAATDQRSPLKLTEPKLDSTIRCIGFPSIADNKYAAASTKWGENDASSSEGTVSRLFVVEGSGTQTIQTDAQFSAGCSGGPMVNADGDAVGINTETVFVEGGTNDKVNYAVEAQMAREMLDKYSVSYEWIGTDPVYETVEATVKVKWNDSSNKDKKRPSELTATLSDGSTVTLNEDNKWQGSVKELPKNNSDGTEISYTWTISGISETDYELEKSTDSDKNASYTYKRKGSSSSFNWPLIIGLVVGGIVAIIAIVLIVRQVGKRRKKKATYKPEQVAIPTNTNKNQHVSGPTVKVDSTKKDQVKPQTSEFSIQCVAGACSGETRAMPTTGHVMMGRSNSCGFTLPQGTPGVSARHCEVWIDNGSIYICDLGSSYGTYVQPSIRLVPNQAMKLEQNQEFWLGDEGQRFRIVKGR